MHVEPQPAFFQDTAARAAIDEAAIAVRHVQKQPVGARIDGRKKQRTVRRCGAAYDGGEVLEDMNLVGKPPMAAAVTRHAKFRKGVTARNRRAGGFNDLALRLCQRLPGRDKGDPVKANRGSGGTTGDADGIARRCGDAAAPSGGALVRNPVENLRQTDEFRSWKSGAVFSCQLHDELGAEPCARTIASGRRRFSYRSACSTSLRYPAAPRRQAHGSRRRGDEPRRTP